MTGKQSFMQNRELSWLHFNERVMDEAKDDAVPLLERLRFLSIFTTNLDEFFRVRVGSLIDMLPLGDTTRDAKSGMTPKDQLNAIYAETRKLYRKRDMLFAELTELLKKHGIQYLDFQELTPEEQTYAEDYFSTDILPVLTPQIIDKLHPFPQLQNKAPAVGAMLERTDGKSVPALLSMPPGLPELFFLPGNQIRFLTMDQLLFAFADAAFSTYRVTEKVRLCITRNADIHAEDEDLELSDDFRQLMKKMLRDRKHLAPLRLELTGEISDDAMKFLTRHLGIQRSQR